MTAIVALLGAGVAALASPRGDEASTSSDSALGTSESVGIPLPKVGDKGTFKLASIVWQQDGTTRILTDEAVAAFEWLEDAQIRYADGSLRWANALLYADYGAGSGAAPSIEKVYFEPGTGRILAREFSAAAENQGSGYLTSTFNLVYVDAAVVQIPAPLCWVRSQVQGLSISVDRAFELPASCRAPGSAKSSAQSVFRVHATGVVAAHPSIQLVEASHASVDASEPTTKIWVSADLAYPLRVEVEPGPGETVSQLLRLAYFTPGSRPLGRDAAPVEAAMPLQSVIPEAYGPNDDGMRPHPFRLSVAIEWMYSDESQARTDDYYQWLQDHPGAYVIAADYEDVTNANKRDQMWDITFGAGPGVAPLRVCPLRTVDRTTFTAGPQNLPTDDVELFPTMKYANCGSGSPFQVPRGLPATMFTWESMEHRWRQLSGATEASRANVYGFKVECVDWTCGELSVEYHIGGASDVVSAAEGTDVGEHANTTITKLRIDETGRSVQYEDFASRRADPVLAESKNSLPSVTPDEEPIEPRALDSLNVRVQPEPAVVYFAGAGALAVLAGVAYYLFEHFRGATAAYTRIRRDEVLDHPVRSQLMQLIETTPGIHLQAILRQLELPNGTALHHLRKLVELGQVTQIAHQGYTCYFVKGQSDYKVMAAAPVLKAAMAVRILETILARPGLSGQALAEAVGTNPKVISYHLHRMQDAGLLSVSRSGKQINVQGTALGRTALVQAQAAGSPPAGKPASSALTPASSLPVPT